MSCKIHPNYGGLRIPRNGCPGCMAFYNDNKSEGVKASRKKTNGTPLEEGEVSEKIPTEKPSEAKPAKILKPSKVHAVTVESEYDMEESSYNTVVSNLKNVFKDKDFEDFCKDKKRFGRIIPRLTRRFPGLGHRFLVEMVIAVLYLDEN